MKRLFILFLCAMGFFSSFAAIITVSNNTSSPGQYSVLQTAITNAAVGDTIYIQGSTTNYGNFTINKRLTLIGAGYAPDSTDYNLPTQLGQLTFDTVFGVQISGSKFIGLIIDGVTYASGDRGFIHSITFEKCYFSYYTYISGNNWIYLNDVFNNTDIDFGAYNNIIISNCFFVSSYLYNSNKSTISIYNSIFLNYQYTMFSSVSYMNVYNSIFWNNSVSGCTNCVFINNITNDDIAVTLPGTGNTGSGNINNTDPQFVSTLPSLSTNIPYSDLKIYNWNLKTSSPGYKKGTDGTDIGFWGGSYINKNLSGMYHQIPLVKNFLVKNPVVQKNGNLQISITATKK